MSICLAPAAPDAGILPTQLAIAVVGASLNGLVWAGLFARWGHRVTLIEESAEVRAAFHAGELYADEPGLWHVLELARAEGSLAVAHSPVAAAGRADVVLLADDPPMDDAGIAWERLAHQAEATAAAMAPAAAMLVVASARDGACGRWVARLAALRPAGVAVCLEPLERGEAIYEALCGERLVFGAVGRVPAVLDALFEPLDRPVVWTTAASAERLAGASAAWRRADRLFWNEIELVRRRAEEELAVWARPSDTAPMA